MLGAGLQGALVALALARTGHAVTVVDRAPECLLGASLTNEGKIHLGFVYAHDRSRRTSRLMLDGALAFGPLLEQWLGPLPWTSLATGPFSYVVLKDSLVPPGELMAAWEELDAAYHDVTRARAANYLGTSPTRLWSPPRACDSARGYLSDQAVAVVETAERSVQLPLLRACVRSRLHETDRITCRYEHEVRTVARSGSGFVVEGTHASGTWRLDAPIVVNCLWDGRLAIDRELGIVPARPWVYRLKYRLVGRLPERLADMPSLTMMLGRFGDVVNYGDGRAYLSWYPTCLQGWSSDVVVPETWMGPCREGVAVTEARDLVEGTLRAMDSIVPGLGDCRIDSVAAGVIFSWGATDIDDLSSELHRRDDIGPAMHDGYITVNTGKLTTAPLFADRVAHLLK